MGWGARDPPDSDPDHCSGPCHLSFSQRIGDFALKNLNFHPSVQQEALSRKV